MVSFEQMSALGYGEVHLKADAENNVRAIIAIHDSRLGPALGGCRFISYSNEEAAAMDALRLARGMTFKAALARLPHGGGKAVLIRPEDDFDREALFRSFARFVEELGGRYITTADSGTGTPDMEVMRRVTSRVAGFEVDNGGSGDPSPYTALGVRRGIEACAKLALERSDLEGLHVAVQGVGNVGMNLCKELKALGARLTVADVRDGLARQAADELGAELSSAAEVHRTECDVFAPCALGGALNDRTIPQLRCRVVAGAANNQLASDRNGEQLFERGLLYAPDYAINAGGLINVAQEVVGYDATKARTRTLKIYDTILTIGERSIRDGEPPHRIADAMVAEILDAAAAD